MKAQVRLRDVAEHAGVSPATVSRTLNGDVRVDADLQRRVNASVAELGYRRNRLARNLRLQRIDAIGVMVSDIENPHFSEMVKVIEDEGFRLGYRVLVCGTNESPDKQSTYLRMLADEHVAGVIVSPSDPDAPEIGELIDAGIPVVAFDREVSDPRADTVIADNVTGLAQATQLLIDLGHRSIAYIGGRKGVETTAERLQGYEQAMRGARLRPRTLVGDFRIEGGHRAVTRVLASADRPTALVVANNFMTLGALKAVREAQLRIPEDLALVGVDDPYWAEFVTPPITSLAQPVGEMARQALSMLLARIDGQTGLARRSVHPLQLLVRTSSGPVVTLDR
ncbi:LacI family DNA-binding transcriptional regulator [Acidothermaceae bacterium B102]|nr:LacI family DNA-binding transcriptional regulator [Acidothermaceae bacterium B102]